MSESPPPDDRALLRYATLPLRLNMVAVATTVATAAGAGAAFLGGHGDWRNTRLAVATTVSTLFYASIWAWATRRRTFSMRVRTLVGVPLASLNAGTVGAAYYPPMLGAWEAFLLCATLGGIVWVPALLATKLLIGVPVLVAEHDWPLGLAHHDRGERLVGAACVLTSTAALWLITTQTAGAARLSLLAVGALAIATGSTAAFLSFRRLRRRANLMRDARAGLHPTLAFESLAGVETLLHLPPADTAYRTPIAAEPLLERQPNGDVLPPNPLRASPLP